MYFTSGDKIYLRIIMNSHMGMKEYLERKNIK